MAQPQSSNPASGEAERLLEMYLSGDSAAFETLVRLYEDRLYGFLGRFVGDQHLAEDIFQQVFLKVAENARGFDHRSSFTTWLFRIARNAAIDEIRRRRRQAVRPGSSEELLDQADPGPDPLERLAGEETRDAILAAVEALPETQREAFLLKEEAELGFQEIADILGCPRDTVKSRFRLAVDKLRSSLSLQGLDPGRGNHA